MKEALELLSKLAQKVLSYFPHTVGCGYFEHSGSSLVWTYDESNNPDLISTYSMAERVRMDLTASMSLKDLKSLYSEFVTESDGGITLQGVCSSSLSLLFLRMM